MKKILFVAMCVLSTFLFNISADNPLGDLTNDIVIFTGTSAPHPHMANVTTPIGMYNSATDVLTVTLDATYYGEYTITIESTLTTVDYYPTSATTVIPLTGADDNITIYIESDECGCWYGELDKAEFGGQMDI